MRPTCFFALLALACDSGKDTGDDNGTLDSGSGDNEVCEGTAPVIEDFSAEEGPVISGEGGEDDQPTLQLMAEYSDEDGDAHVLAMDIWYDAELDGTVDTSGAADFGLDPTAVEDDGGNPVDPCDGHAGSFGVLLGVTGDPLDFETEYDFGVVLYDNAGMGSEPAFITAVTPAAL